VEWLSAIKATIPDQDTDTDTESKETCQKTPQRTVITLPTDWFTREKSKGSGAAKTHMVIPRC
jgi:hypothetical protein